MRFAKPIGIELGGLRIVKSFWDGRRVTTQLRREETVNQFVQQDSDDRRVVSRPAMSRSVYRPISARVPSILRDWDRQ